MESTRKVGVEKENLRKAKRERLKKRKVVDRNETVQGKKVKQRKKKK